jgi:protocatechuate 4,5-dioxygenase beta chain
MPLVFAQAISYSPLLYRPRARWPEIYAFLAGDVTQPLAAADETPERLDAAASKVDAAFGLSAERLAAAQLDALIVLTSDRGQMFDLRNTPQLHVFAGDEIWGDPAIPELGEQPNRVSFTCDALLARTIAEELAIVGFDVSEGTVFSPLGNPERGVGAALIEPLLRLALPSDTRIVPIHINAHVAPAIAGRRAVEFGAALAHALALVPGRTGILASGGLSGDPRGRLAGWIDDVLDQWVLQRLASARSRDIGAIFEVESQTFHGTTAEIRLWMAAGAAMESSGSRGHLTTYLPLSHAAVGTAFMHWENARCQ